MHDGRDRVPDRGVGAQRGQHGRLVGQRPRAVRTRLLDHDRLAAAGRDDEHAVAAGDVQDLELVADHSTRLDNVEREQIVNDVWLLKHLPPVRGKASRWPVETSSRAGVPMLLTDHVALTSLTSSVSTRSLMIVASAIQKQVTRDFGPIWGVRGTVDAFAELTDVPSDYYHVIVFNDPDELVGRLEDTLGEQLAAELIATFDADQISGIHLNAWTRQPFALVQALDESWPAVASHEVLEVLADPYGNRLLAAAHPLDPGERVRYLLEVCDPCQQISYTVNGVPM